ncbi:MAG: hypothetical protein ACK5LC_09870 [Coprobacillaceae bacterium]
MLESNKPYQLLFVLPLANGTTLLGYDTGRVEILEISIKKFFRSQYAVQEEGYKAPMYMQGIFLYPTTGKRNPNCCWIHMDIMCGNNILEHCELLQRYVESITVEKILQMYTKMIKAKSKSI